ncbi:MAG: hypothetical protein ACE5EC_05010, partial [Phycisphaerae bacterium]
MEAFWKDYIEEYVNEPFYWWQPKAFTISSHNLPEIKKKLEELALFDGKKWRSAQRRYAKRLQERGLFKPRKATRSAKDYPAIV